MLVYQLTRRIRIVMRGESSNPLRQCSWAWLCIIALVCIIPIPAYSQTTGHCDTSSLISLEEVIHAHNDDSYRKDRKFEDIWFYQGSVPKKVISKISLKTIIGHLGELGERKSVVLLYRVDFDKLWTWLITANGRMVCANSSALKPEDWEALDSKNWTVLGARGARHARAVFEDVPGQDDEAQRPHWAGLLERLSKILLPKEVADELRSSNSDTLVVVPITLIRRTAPGQTEMTVSLSTLPFAALPFDAGTLIDKFSIVISPGFSSFGKTPKEARKQFRDPIVLGNPIRSTYPNLPGAEDEAKQVAARLGTRAFVGKSAKKSVLETYLRKHAASVDLIHLATHGVADAKNPLDKSILVFSDSSWNARQIGTTLHLTGDPLVVMSACQTALGKDFPSGTIGLAQAWQRAGASNVVMSLWSVDDTPTKELMEQFVDLVASGQAVDKALQAAMLSLREKYPNPSHWASFSIYGAPERIGVTSTHPSIKPGRG